MSFRLWCSRRMIDAASAVRRLSHGGLFVAGGLRTLADFQREVAGYFEDYNEFPDEIAGGLNPFEERMYRKAVKPGGRVCVIGCGTGRDLLPFVAAGHDVVGIEPAHRPVEQLRRALAVRGSSATIIQGFVEHVTMPGAFDTIILSPHCYSHIPGTARRVAVLNKLGEHLTPDGRLAINFLRRTGSWSRLGVRLAAITATLSGSDCPWEPHDVVQLMEMDGDRAILFEHIFLPDEVAEEVARAGLRVIDSEVDEFLGPMTIAGR